MDFYGLLRYLRTRHKFFAGVPRLQLKMPQILICLAYSRCQTRAIVRGVKENRKRYRQSIIICCPGFENLRTVQLKCRFTTGVKLFLNLHSYINTPAYSLNYFMKYCSRKIQVLKNWNAPSEKITPNCGAASSVLHCSLDVLIRNSRETVGDVKMIIKCRWILKNFFQYCKIMKISTRVKYIPP